MLTGVGGQGVILASMIAADALMRAGHDVKQSEVHGMAQRGGSVFSHIRFGPKVESPLVPLASAEVMAAFEWAEALRWMQYVRKGGAVVADVRTVIPPGACVDKRTWATTYPSIDGEILHDREVKAHLIDATTLAADLGNIRAANSVVLGAAASFLDIGDAHWEEAIARFVPSGTEDINLAAFRAGREAPQATLGAPASDVREVAPLATIEVRHDWCKACDICSRVCPEYCLAIQDGTLHVTAPERCTGCRLCEMLCPDFAIAIGTAQQVAT